MKYQFLLDDQESLPWRRRSYERHAFLKELLTRAESRSTFGLKYLDHLQRHDRAVKNISKTKSVKSIADSQYFKLNWDEDTKKWVFRIKVIYIVYIFFACYNTFQIARDGMTSDEWIRSAN